MSPTTIMAALAAGLLGGSTVPAFILLRAPWSFSDLDGTARREVLRAPL